MLRLDEVPAPVPGPGELLIRIRAASVNAMDAHLLHGRPAFTRLFTGLRRPKEPRIGVDFAGEVAAIGAETTRFAPGDEVFGVSRGAFADYACAAEDKLATKPATLAFEQAAALPVAGLTALQGLREAGKLSAGEKVLVVGAGGGVGSYAVQIARALGADVTAVTEARHVARLGALGAPRVLDRARGNFTDETTRYDLIFDLAGNRPFGQLQRVLTPGGRVVAAGIGALATPTLGVMAAWGAGLGGGMLRSRFGGQKLILCMAKVRGDDLDALAAMVAAGAVTPPITRRFALAETAEAMRTFLDGSAGGKLMILP